MALLGNRNNIFQNVVEISRMVTNAAEIFGNTNNAETKIGKRFQYWEPIYSPEDVYVYKDLNWDGLEHDKGPTRYTCKSEDIKINSLIIEKVRFSYCDFRGEFSLNKMTFKKCVFEFCDLGYSTWNRVKFQECEFKSCSLTMSTFDSCQFLDCEWEKIGISGNETKMFNTLLTNPEKFVSAAYTNLDPNVLKQFNTSPSYQKMRLEASKAKIARIILLNLEKNGDEVSYYRAIKTYLNQSINARISDATHQIYSRKKVVLNSVRVILLRLEKFILNVSGLINAWGYSISLPAVFGLFVIFSFGLLYYFLGLQSTLFMGLMAGLDITMLAGYTKHASKDSSLSTQILYAANMVFGLWWYAIFVPTVINRISRIRS